MVSIHDISDKGRKPNKSLRYEVGYYCKPNPHISGESPIIVAKFRCYGDAYNYAQSLSKAPDPTMVLIRS